MTAGEPIPTCVPRYAAERLSSLVAAIYDAAFDPTRWATVLADVAIFVGGCAAVLYSRNDLHQWGLDPHFVDLYRGTYIRLDPVAVGYSIVDIEEPISTGDIISNDKFLIPNDKFLATRFYKEWAKPQGFVDSVHAALEKSAENSAALVVFRHERDGPVDDEVRRRMRLVAPHFRRAVMLRNLIVLNKIGTAALADVLDAINAAIFLVNAAGWLVHANAAGRTMLGATSVLHIEDGRLAAEDQATDRALREAFATAVNGDTAEDTRSIVVPFLAPDGADHKNEHYLCHVLPLAGEVRRHADASFAVAAALFVHKAFLNLPSRREAIAKAYKLTAMELRVLLAVVEVGGVPEVADALGVAETTVKTHLGRIFTKTNSSRQADLVKIVAGFASPIAR